MADTHSFTRTSQFTNVGTYAATERELFPNASLLSKAGPQGLDLLLLVWILFRCNMGTKLRMVQERTLVSCHTGQQDRAWPTSQRPLVLASVSAKTVIPLATEQSGLVGRISGIKQSALFLKKLSRLWNLQVLIMPFFFFFRNENIQLTKKEKAFLITAVNQGAKGKIPKGSWSFFYVYTSHCSYCLP